LFFNFDISEVGLETAINKEKRNSLGVDRWKASKILRN